jgi:hypothetical protein
MYETGNFDINEIKADDRHRHHFSGLAFLERARTPFFTLYQLSEYKKI